MIAEAAWLLTVIVLRPAHSERHPTVEFSYEQCWQRGLAVFDEERFCGVITGFRCHLKQ